jgi:fatty acid desaturase
LRFPNAQKRDPDHLRFGFLRVVEGQRYIWHETSAKTAQPFISYEFSKVTILEHRKTGYFCLLIFYFQKSAGCRAPMMMAAVILIKAVFLLITGLSYGGFCRHTLNFTTITVLDAKQSIFHVHRKHGQSQKEHTKEDFRLRDDLLVVRKAIRCPT